MSDLKINYTILTTITSVTEAKERKHLSGSGPAEVHTHISLGWFVTFEGSYESLYFGDEKPEFEKGDKVKITFAKEP